MDVCFLRFLEHGSLCVAYPLSALVMAGLLWHGLSALTSDLWYSPLPRGGLPRLRLSGSVCLFL
uniref:Uncharacterized protein n=1 Tax=Anguilla anguilla TaxID=7936 RepID=A0A0E9PKV5_ANGAN